MRNGNSKIRLTVILFAETPGYLQKLAEAVAGSGELIDIHSFDRIADVLNFLESSPADLLVAEHTLPSADPVRIVDFLRERSLNVTYILVTDCISEENAVELFQRGVDDYILSDRLFRLPLIVRKINTRRRLQEGKSEAEKSAIMTNLALENERGRIIELLSHAPAGIGILKGPNHVFHMINPFYYEMIGKQDVIGMPLAEALPHLAPQGFIALFDEVYKTGKTLKGNEVKATVLNRRTGLSRDIYINFIFQAYKNIHGDIEGTFFFINDVTEQVLARRVVEESELRYKQIVETAQEGIWLTNEQGITIFVNKKLCEILGYEESEIIGKHYATFLARGYSEEEMIQWERSEKWQLDMQFFSKMGTSVWTTVSSNSMYDEKGQYRGTMAMISDITDKKKLEELLEKATTMARIGSFEVDFFSNKLYWSKITKEIHEVEEDYVCDFNTAVRYFKEGLSRDIIQNSFREAYTKGYPLDREVQIVTAKGNERWVRVIAEAEFINGECSKFIGSIQDIDAQKKVEIELLKTINEKEDILESIGDGFITVDREWKVTYWNQKAELFAQVKRADILGRNLWDTIPQLIDTPLYLPFQKAMATGTVQQAEAIYKPTNRWYDNTVFPSPTGLSIYFRDVTERKEADIKLMQLNEELRKYTSELIISNKELEQFSYIISHNLRAPVANIKGLLDAMNDKSYSEEVQAALRDSLSSSVQVLDDIITDLNSILSLKTEVSERKEEVDLELLTQKIVMSIQTIIREEDVTVETDFSEVGTLFTLKTYLHSIFYNLILNSIKYRQPHVPPVIHIRSAMEDNQVVVSFRDNGMGIDLTKGSDEMFGLYKRFHTHKEGKGLGLFMVKSQMGTLGGSIKVNSQVNVGTEFKLIFPLTK
jgi:PAS domain S-box-containing protein